MDHFSFIWVVIQTFEVDSSAHSLEIASFSCSRSPTSSVTMTQVFQTEKVEFFTEIALVMAHYYLHLLVSWLVWVAGSEQSSWWEVWNQTLCWKHWSKNNRVRIIFWWRTIWSWCIMNSYRILTPLFHIVGPDRTLFSYCEIHGSWIQTLIQWATTLDCWS